MAYVSFQWKLLQVISLKNYQICYKIGTSVVCNPFYGKYNSVLQCHLLIATHMTCSHIQRVVCEKVFRRLGDLRHPVHRCLVPVVICVGIGMTAPSPTPFPKAYRGYRGLQRHSRSKFRSCAVASGTPFIKRVRRTSPLESVEISIGHKIKGFKVRKKSLTLPEAQKVT